MLAYRGLTTVLIVAGLTAAGARAAAPNLAERVRAEKGAFRALTDQDLAAARANLTAAAADLEARLARAGQSAEGWREYLRWEELQAGLKKPEGPDLQKLEQVFARLSGGHEGLGLVEFANLADAIRRYVSIARGLENGDVQAQYEKVIESLAARVESYQQSPTGEDAAFISAYLKWLSDARQAPGLIEPVRSLARGRNLRAGVSQEVLEAGLGQEVDDTMPVSEVILGTRVYGTGHTIGRVSVALVPSEDRAVLMTVMNGITTTDTVGYNGPVVIYSDGLTSITTHKQIIIDAERISGLPAQASASTSSTIRSICARSHLIERIAWNRAAKQKCEADWIASRLAERRGAGRFDAEVGSLLHAANEDLENDIRQPLLERRLYPAETGYSTDPERLSVSLLQAGPFDLGAPTAPPDPVAGADLTLQIHESMVNNFASAALAGMIIREERAREALTQILGELPEQLEPDEQSEPWGVRFQMNRPVWVAFADNRFTISIRGNTFFEGETRHPGMDVTVTYRIVAEGESWKAVREGDLEIFPPGFDPAGGRQLTTAQTVVRRLLQRRLGRVFEEEIIPEDLVLPNQWRRTGTLKLVQWTAQEGWMAMAWERTGQPAPEPAGEDPRLAALR